MKRGEVQFSPQDMKLRYILKGKDALPYYAKLKDIMEKLSEKVPELRGIEVEVVETQEEEGFKGFVQEARKLFGG